MEQGTRKTYRIFSNYRWDFYRIDEDGNVLETENGKISSGSWKITGAWYRGSYGNICFIGLEQLLDTHRFLYKNGVPIFGLTDIDHGTSRLCGNKAVHGIKFIRAEI